MFGCAYTWQNKDKNAERDENGKKKHPFHTCKNKPHGPGFHECECGETREKAVRNRKK